MRAHDGLDVAESSGRKRAFSAGAAAAVAVCLLYRLAGYAVAHLAMGGKPRSAHYGRDPGAVCGAGRFPAFHRADLLAVAQGTVRQI